MEPIVHEFKNAWMNTLLDKGIPSTFPNLEVAEAPLLEVWGGQVRIVFTLPHAHIKCMITRIQSFTACD